MKHFIFKDICASLICPLPGETCAEGICTCGYEKSCHGNSTAPTCDAANGQCICGSIGFSSKGCSISGEVCIEGECMCGSIPSCEGNAINSYCDAENSKCVAGV